MPAYGARRDACLSGATSAPDHEGQLHGLPLNFNNRHDKVKLNLGTGKMPATQEAQAMASMSYCEFQNAASDLRSGVEGLQMGDKTMSQDEAEAAREILELAKELADLLGEED